MLNSMSNTTRWIIGLTLISLVTIEYGGTFLLAVLSGEMNALGLTEFQRGMFRAGHAHAGVLVLLSLIGQQLVDHLSVGPRLPIRIGLVAAPLLVSGGFFAAAIGPGLTAPNSALPILWMGVVVLGLTVLALGVALIRSRGP